MKGEKKVLITCSTPIEGLMKTYLVEKAVFKLMAEMYKKNPDKYSAPNGRDLLIAATEALELAKKN